MVATPLGGPDRIDDVSAAFGISRASSGRYVVSHESTTELFVQFWDWPDSETNGSLVSQSSGQWLLHFQESEQDVRQVRAL